MNYVKVKQKRGNSIVAIPIILILSLLSIIYVGVFVLNSIVPFIWYQKLNTISQKYMFVIEKYGYLTNDEENLLVNDLKTQGFDMKNIIIEAPKLKKNYGELLTFSIEYYINEKMPSISQGKFASENKNLKIGIRKNSYSKI